MREEQLTDNQAKHIFEACEDWKYNGFGYFGEVGPLCLQVSNFSERGGLIKSSRPEVWRAGCYLEEKKLWLVDSIRHVGGDISHAVSKEIYEKVYEKYRNTRRK